MRISLLLPLLIFSLSGSLFADSIDRAAYDALSAYNNIHGEYLPIKNDGITATIETTGLTSCEMPLPVPGYENYSATIDGSDPRATGTRYANNQIDVENPALAKPICDLLKRSQGKDYAFFFADSIQCSLTLASGTATCTVVLGPYPTAVNLGFGK